MSAWTEEEDKKLVRLLEEHNNDYNKIMKYFPERTKKSLSCRWWRINPSVKSGKWDQEEDIKLVQWVFDWWYPTIQSAVNIFDNRKQVQKGNQIE